MALSKRAFLATGLAASLLPWGITNGQSVAYLPLSAEDFLRRLGITTHINYLDGAYANIDRVLECLNYLGIGRLREMTPAPWLGGAPPMSHYQKVLDQGYTFNLVAHNGAVDLTRTLNEMRSLAAYKCNGVRTLEGFNEIDHSPVTYAGSTGQAAAIGAQIALYSAIKADAALKALPVYDLTGVPFPQDITGRADKMNVHLYPQNGFPPDGWFRGHRGLVKATDPLVATEFGYASIPESGWLIIGVGEEGQAKGILSGIFASFLYGFENLFLYQLLDEKPDAAGSNREHHFGLFTNTYTPKLSAKAVRFVLGLLKSTLPQVTTPSSVALSPFGFPSSGHLVPIAMPDNRLFVACWNEMVFWDRATGRPISNAKLSVGLDVPTSFTKWRLHDPLTQAASAQAQITGTRINFDLPDYPVLIELIP